MRGLLRERGDHCEIVWSELRFVREDHAEDPEPAAGDRRFERRDERGPRAVFDEERALRVSRRPRVASREPHRAPAPVRVAHRRVGCDRDARVAFQHQLAERSRHRNEVEEAVLGRERDAGPLRVDGFERVRHERLCGSLRVGGRGHGRDRVLEQGDARERTFASRRVDDDAAERHATPLRVVEPEEAGFGEAHLAREMVRTGDRDAVHRLAAGEDLPHDRFELVGELGDHVPHGLAEVRLDGAAVELGEPVVDGDVAELGIERGQPDRCGTAEPAQQPLARLVGHRRNARDARSERATAPGARNSAPHRGGR